MAMLDIFHGRKPMPLLYNFRAPSSWSENKGQYRYLELFLRVNQCQCRVSQSVVLHISWGKTKAVWDTPLVQEIFLTYTLSEDQGSFNIFLVREPTWPIFAQSPRPFLTTALSDNQFLWHLPWAETKFWMSSSGEDHGHFGRVLEWRFRDIFCTNNTVPSYVFIVGGNRGPLDVFLCYLPCAKIKPSYMYVVKRPGPEYQTILIHSVSKFKAVSP